MDFSFFRKKEQGDGDKLPKEVRAHLIRRFRLKPGYVDTLRYFHTEGRGERATTRFRVFSPAKAKEQGLAIARNADLDLHHDIVAFEGQIDEHGTIRASAVHSPHSMEPHK